MKKSFLLPFIVMASGAVYAQSSVTMFGVLDVGVIHTKGGANGSVTALGNGGYSTSRLGFRGTEDLGNGLKAGFWLEGSLNPDNGTGRATNTNNQPSGATTAGPLTFDRLSYLSLSHSRVGELRLGREYVPTHYNSIFFDPFNANGVARAGNFTFAGVGTGPLPTAIAASNAIGYWLPSNLGGLYGNALVGRGENSSGAANSSDGNLFGARLGFKAGKFDIAVAQTRSSFTSTLTIGDYVHSNLGVSWDAGFAKLFGLYNRADIDIISGNVKKDTFEIGAIVPVGGNGKIRFSYASLNDKSASSVTNSFGGLARNDDARQFGLGYVHDLSKRTAVYGTYAHLKNKGQGRYVVSGGQAPNAGRNSSGIELGLRHNF